MEMEMAAISGVTSSLTMTKCRRHHLWRKARCPSLVHLRRRQSCPRWSQRHHRRHRSTILFVVLRWLADLGLPMLELSRCLQLSHLCMQLSVLLCCQQLNLCSVAPQSNLQLSSPCSLLVAALATASNLWARHCLEGSERHRVTLNIRRRHLVPLLVALCCSFLVLHSQQQHTVVAACHTAPPSLGVRILQRQSWQFRLQQRTALAPQMQLR